LLQARLGHDSGAGVKETCIRVENQTYSRRLRSAIPSGNQFDYAMDAAAAPALG
jgi:hypothetical protein